jgi:CO dehydrogenase maturation factor
MMTIAVSGKGGTGKSTCAALVIRWLRSERSKAILAVDADPNTSLGEMLGVESAETVGGVREEMKRLGGRLPGGMSKQQFLEYKIHTGLVETPDFDLIAMGRPEGPGCYCYANNLLRDILNTLSGNYDYVVIDNEAGMEHLSRRTTRNIDHLLMISDPTVRGVRTAGRISRLSDELTIEIRAGHLILNRVREPLSRKLTAAIADERLAHLCSIPEDDRLLSQDRAGRPIWPVLAESKAYEAVNQPLSRLLGG